MREHLIQKDPTTLACFTDLENADQRKLSDIRLARKTGGFAFEYWCAGGDLKDVERLLDHFNTISGGQCWQEDADDKDVLTRNRVASGIYQNAVNVMQRSMDNDVWSLSLLDREKLLHTWKDEIDPRTILDRTAEIHRRHQIAVRRKTEIYSEIDARSLAERGSST